MNRLQAVARLDALIQGRWNLVGQVRSRTDMRKSEKAMTISHHKLDIEALQMAREALKNPGYSPKGVTLETGADG